MKWFGDFSRKNAFLFFRKYWGFSTLSILVLIIWVTNFSVEKSIIGWDNFSVSLDLSQNFFRTLFASWRETRGLGVASDSEVTDVFRQLLLLALSLVVPNKVVDQTYYLLLLAGGVLGTYFLAKEVAKDYFNDRYALELSGFLSGFLYFFSLYTVGVFYVPIAMYVIRYAFFPLFLYCLLHLLKMPKVTFKWLSLFAVITLLGSASYITATVFVTLMLFLPFIAISFFSKFKRFLFLLLFFVCLNSFWLLIFANYTKEKADIVSQASTFIEVNQIQLNQPSHVFSWDKILIAYPSFFYTTVNQLNSLEKVPLHPMATFLKKQPFLQTLLLLPAWLSLFGTILVLIKLKKTRSGIWLIAVLGISLFFLRKEHPPTGFLYDLASKHLPLIKIIFRFGGEKFYPLMAVSLMVLAGLIIGYLISKLPTSINRKIGSLVLILLLTSTIYPFLGSFKGNFFSQHTQAVIPDQYRQMASVINEESSEGRVLHLPTDSSSYWKSYTWGFVGSSFLNFLLEKPLLDRTFEPASLENDYFNQAVAGLISNSSLINSNELAYRAQNLALLLQKTNTKYLLLDETVNVNVDSQGLRYFGNFPLKDSQVLVEKMEELHLLTKQSEQKIGDPVSGKSLTLYIVPGSSTIFSSPAKKKNVTPTLENGFNQALIAKSFIQTDLFPNRTYPFHQPDSNLVFTPESVSLEQTFTDASPLKYGFDSSVKTFVKPQQGYDVYVEKQNSDLLVLLKPSKVQIDINSDEINFNTVITTTLKNVDLKVEAPGESEKYLNDWHVLGTDVGTYYRLVVGNNILPLPKQIVGQTKVGSVLLTPSQQKIGLLEKNNSVVLSPYKLSETEDPNCYADKQAGYAHQVRYMTGSVILSTEKGTSCITTQLQFEANKEESYSEISVGYKVNEGNDNQNISLPKSLNSWENVSAETITSHPQYTYATACLINRGTGQCLNTHKVLTATTLDHITLTPSELVDPSRIQLLLTVPTQGSDKRQLEVKDLSYRTYSLLHEQEVDIPINTVSFQPITQVVDNKINIQIPYFLGKGSFYFNSKIDGLETYTGDCHNPTGYLTTRTILEKSRLPVGFVSNCNQGLFELLPFSAETFALWTTDYYLLSGKNPKFTLKGTGTYKDEYLERFNDFQNTYETKNLQIAEPISVSTSYSDLVEGILTTESYRPAFTTLYSQSVKNEKPSLVFEVTQQSENQGVISARNLNLISLPTEWQSLYVENGNSELTFDQLNISNTQRILPSLWKVTLAPSKSPNTGKYLLQFGQAYDRQWAVYETPSIVKAFLGLDQLKAQHVKADGWSNAWIIETDELTEPSTIIVFYTPEKLAVIGWLITLATVVGMITWGLRSRLRRSR